MNVYGITPLDYWDFWRDILISLQIFLYYILNAVEDCILPYLLEEKSSIKAARMLIIAT